MTISDIINNLSNDDKQRYETARITLRKAYLTAHNLIIGIDNWTADDEGYLDYVDGMLKSMFEQSGRVRAVKENEAQAQDRVEKDLAELVGKRSNGAGDVWAK